MQVDYFDGRTAQRHLAHLSLEQAELVLRGDFGEYRVPLEAVEISEPLGRSPRFIHLPDQRQCEISQARLDDFAQWLLVQGIRQGGVSHWQNHGRFALSALVATVGLLMAAYIWLLPALADWLAPKVPESFLVSLSSQALGSLDGKVLQPSKLETNRQLGVQAEVAAMVRGQSVPHYQLHFRDAQGLPPNAFALPSGDVVIFDSLIKLAPDDVAVAAVVAHELGHVQARHGIRQLIESSVVSFVAAAYLGDVSSVASGMAALVLSARYSRQFEAAADDYAVRLLKQTGRNPGALADMLEKLEQQQAGGGGLFASHPDTAARVAKIRAAGESRN